LTLFTGDYSASLGELLAFSPYCWGLSLSQLPNLRLDASSDSLLLQGDPDLAYFRESSAKYQGSEFLVLTWEPDAQATVS
jgi:hypothetical protein